MRTIKELDIHPPINLIFDLYKNEKNAVFLDSSLKNDLGQYSIIGLYPYLELINGNEFTVNGVICEEPFEIYLKEILKTNHEENDTILPITSGAIGYFSYDYGAEKANIQSRHNHLDGIPKCVFCFYDVFIIENNKNGKLYIVANGNTKNSSILVDEIVEHIYSYDFDSVANEASDKVYENEIEFNMAEDVYKKSINNLINYIVEGDIYVVNMTQQLKIKSKKDPYSFFKKLRQINPSPFGGYLNYGNHKIISSSPERFLRMKNNVIETRPIKGTRKRGINEEDDMKIREELTNSEKDKSELLMIVDLERNDLNKVSIPGSVEVSELFKTEEYATVFHLVSNITSKLKDNKTVLDLIYATFPGGSITGAPKIRAMEIIDEVEASNRNIYTGIMGYISFNGDCDFNIIIRTALYYENEYHLGVGGGITCESDVDFEFEEILQKSKAILEALK